MRRRRGTRPGRRSPPPAASWVTMTIVWPKSSTAHGAARGSRRRLRVEVAGRLVGEDDGRAGDQRPRHGDALLLAAGELGRAVRAAAGEADAVDQLVDPRLVRLAPAISQREGMFSSAVSIGSRLKNWKTKPTWVRRSFVSSRSSRPVISTPSISTAPGSGGRGRRGCASASTCRSRTAPSPRSARRGRRRSRRRAARRRPCRPRRSGGGARLR